jgi:large subunit ribosomal protein L22
MEKENKNKEKEASPSESGLKEELVKEEKTEKPVKEPEKEGEKPKEKLAKEEKTEKKPVQEKPKKTEAVVNAHNLPISTKYSAAICKFIKNKKIEHAIADLEQVLVLKKAVPMKGEIPHRKGKGMMSGRFPKKATENFIRLLKSLLANANHNSLENPIIVEAIANIGARPYGKFGRVRKKRTHVKIKVKEKKGD